MSSLSISDSSASAQPARRSSPRRGQPWATPLGLLLINVLATLGMAMWLAYDPDFDAAVQSLLWGHGTWDPLRCWVLLGALGSLAVQGLAWLGAFFWGPAPWRQLTSLAGLTVVIGLWLSLVVNYPELTWQAKRWRLQDDLPVLDEMALPLIESWPQHDGTLPAWGPFMAYPAHRPQTLLLLTPPQLTPGGPFVSAVERTPEGALRFELSGREGGDWLEWHPPQAPPSSTQGGLQETFHLQRATRIGGAWYLVRYASR